MHPSELTKAITSFATSELENTTLGSSVPVGIYAKSYPYLPWPLKELPSNVSYNVAFYNFQNIAVELLGLDELIQLNPTKLYFLLKRCSSTNPDYRIFFYI